MSSLTISTTLCFRVDELRLREVGKLHDAEDAGAICFERHLRAPQDERERF
jgi:hypothetical protein